MYSIYADLRDKKGVTDYAVSKATGVGRSTLSDWKQGRHIPNTENLRKIADYFGVSVDYFFSNNIDYQAKIPFLLSPDEIVLIENIRKADNVTSEAINRMLAYSEAISKLKK